MQLISQFQLFRKQDKMKLFLRYFLSAILLCLCLQAVGQNAKWRDVYKVKKKDTVYGIARKYNLTEEELARVNPEMKVQGYVLKEGDFVFIPFSSSSKAKPSASAKPAVTHVAQGKTVKVGIMLPLHRVDGDGLRMTEYYRGFLMACDSLRQQGISVDIHAWNVAVTDDITRVTADPAAAQCNVIFGPLYSTQVHGLAEFCRARDIKMVIPFSISGDDVSLYSQIYQVWQSPDRLTNNAIEYYLKTFPRAHVVFVDSNDKTSKKGSFTFGLRQRLEALGQHYGITNLTSSADAFAKQFSSTETNVVVINTGRSPELTALLGKLQTLRAANPGLRISLWGYTEWLMYLGIDKEKFHLFDTYIPSTFFYNPYDERTRRFEASYRTWFHTDMQQALPRFAITGYDQAQFFLRGFANYGKNFKGRADQNSYRAMQSPLSFKQISTAGMQNDYFQLVHFRTDGGIDALSYAH